MLVSCNKYGRKRLNMENKFVDHFIDAYPIGDIAVSCIICHECTPMSLNDYRARGAFVCDKCRAAVKQLRKILEDGENIT